MSKTKKADVVVEEQIISYERTFVISACHFNGQQTYDRYREARQLMAEEEGETEKIRHAAQLLLDVLPDIHGHNFRVTVMGTRPLGADDDCVVVWDEDLEATVREWDRTNLSVHPDFTAYRATTEVIAVLLKEKLVTKWQDVFWSVEVEETEDISAVAS